jgi:DNA/RNA endonuclease G (NUC1)
MKVTVINYSKVFIIVFTLLGTITLVGCNEDKALPKITAVEVSTIYTYSAICNGKVLDDGGTQVLSKGVCWNTTGNPTISDYRNIDGKGIGEFTSTIKGLAPNTTYYIKAYATNANGTTYSNSVSFKTQPELATISDISFTSVTKTAAQCSASIISAGGETVTERGFCWSKSPMPTIANNKIALNGGIGSFSATLENLESGTQYYIRAYAITSAGTSYSVERIFTTASENPALVDNDHLLLGNPTGATTNIVNANNYLMVKPQYCLSYNNSKRTANWVAWHLNSSWLGSVSRQDDFRADYTLPDTWYHVTESDYYYSQYGFDRGHMCPSADRTATVADNSATFLMTNMVPQSPNNNQIVWESFESYCRNLAKSGSELYIISGPYGEGGTSSKGTFTILKSGVVVPSHVWKIALVLPNGNNDISRINTSTRVIAVVIPNNQECSKYQWTYYRVSVDSVENLTGYNFFTNIPTDIQDALEAKVDNQ